MNGDTRVTVLAAAFISKRKRRMAVLCRTNGQGCTVPVPPGVYIATGVARIEYMPKRDGVGDVFAVACVTKLQTGVTLDDLRDVEVKRA